MSRRLTRRGRGEDEGDTVNLSPLIDMTFLLLIFFVVSSTLVDDIEIPIERPGASSGAPVETKALRVAVTGDETVAVDGEPVPRWMVEPRVRHVLGAHPSGRVLVVADRRVEADLLVDVVDQCRLAGAKHVAVAVKEETP
jgi:biopolymer transport protein ExbD